MDLGKFGVWRGKTQWDADLAAEMEDLGFGALWIGGSPPGSLEDAERVLAATRQIPVATGIVNMWREDPVTAGRSYLRLADAYPDRLLLGIGVGHPESIDRYSRPLVKIGDYLDRLSELGVPPDRVILGALGPKALAVAAHRTGGAHPYLTTPRHTRMAREIMGEGPLLAPEQKVVIGESREEDRRVGRDMVRRYLSLSNYRNSLLREGWAEQSLSDGGEDRLIDELVLHGTVEEIAAGLTAHLVAGADHVCIQVLGQDAISSYRALAALLLK